MEIAIYANRPDFKRGAVRGPSAAPADKSKIDRKCLFEGKTGQVGNFMFLVGRAGEDTGYHPRHRHDFDQVRFVVKGKLEIGPKKIIDEGCIAYFPAGTPYGPYEGGVYLEPEIISAQFEGACRANYVSFGSPEVRAAIQELSTKGEFKNGVYTWYDERGKKHNKDGLEAAVDHVRGAETVHPKPRYDEAIIIDPAHFDWVEVARGAHMKALGTFTERETRLAMIRIEGGTCRISSPDRTTLLIVVQGTGTANGQRVSGRDGVRLDPSDQVELSSDESMELFMLGLPKLATRSLSDTIVA